MSTATASATAPATDAEEWISRADAAPTSRYWRSSAATAAQICPQLIWLPGMGVVMDCSLPAARRVDLQLLEGSHLDRDGDGVGCES